MKAAILVGGRGTRLGLTDRPKPMIDFMGCPLLQHIIENIASQGIKDIVLFSGYLAHVIEDYFGDGRQFDVKITHIVEKAAQGTAGAFRGYQHLFNSPFFVFYGDILFDVDLKRFQSFSQNKGGLGTLLVHPNDHPFDSDLIEVDKKQRITKVHAKPHNLARTPNLVNAAMYYFTPAIINKIPAHTPVDWGRDVFPGIVDHGGELYAYRSAEYAKDVGTPERLKKAKKDFVSGTISTKSYKNRQKAIFIDRDGVINQEIGGVYAPEDFILCEGVAQAIKQINESPYLAILITNQPGLAKGFMSFETLNDIHKEMETLLAKEGAILDDILFCPHHPEKGFSGEVSNLKHECSCRKPNPGLLLEASLHHNIDFSGSFMIGDRCSDLDAAKRAGVRSIFVRGTEELENEISPYAEVDSLLKAVELIWKFEP